MTTTATETTVMVARDTGTRVLVRAGVASVVVGAALVVVAALVADADAARGALVGTLLAVGVFAFGSITVEVVSRVMPSASLLVALMTYALQVVVMALAFAVLDGAGALDDGLDPAWVGGAVIVGTACWLIAQIVLTMRRRIPVYDLPDDARDGRPEGSAR